MFILPYWDTEYLLSCWLTYCIWWLVSGWSKNVRACDNHSFDICCSVHARIKCLLNIWFCSNVSLFFLVHTHMDYVLGSSDCSYTGLDSFLVSMGPILKKKIVVVNLYLDWEAKTLLVYVMIIISCKRFLVQRPSISGQRTVLKLLNSIVLPCYILVLLVKRVLGLPDWLLCLSE